MTALAHFQDRFAKALADPSPKLDEVTVQPGFAVYRNTVMKGLIDTLEANFPAILALVGEEWFRAAAAEFARQQPPDSPIMALYGASFASFLADFKPAVDMPYLGEVAALDWLWVRSATAPSSEALTMADIAGIAEDDLAGRTVKLHPALQVHWSKTTAPTIWLDARGIEPRDELGFTAAEEGILITRSAKAVAATRLSLGGQRLIDRLSKGATLGWALAEASRSEPGLDLGGFVGTLFNRGAIAALPPPRKTAT